MEAARQYCLKWNNHPRNVASVFDKLRMEELFVDVTLATADRQVTLHSCSNSPTSSSTSTILLWCQLCPVKDAAPIQPIAVF